MSKNNLYFVFSSITFLQLYIPIVNEANKRNFDCYFILRKNTKNYADPYHHTEILNKFITDHKIKIIDSNENFPTGIYFVVDADVYGPPRNDTISQSLLGKVRSDKNNIILNLNEHMNFIDKYDLIQKYCNYSFVESKDLIDFWSNINEEEYDRRNMRKFNSEKFVKIYDSEKNIYGINTKFDNKIEVDIYKKFNIDKDGKYCLFLYPKVVSFSEDDIINIFSHLKKLNYKIIVKARPKSSYLISNKKLKGDYYIESDIYPNETLGLLKIVDLCIFSSSSAQTECLYNYVPCLDLESDIRQQWLGFEFLLDNKFYKKLDNCEWKNIDFEKFSSLLSELDTKKSKYIQNLRNEYFKIDNSSEFILNFIENLNKKFLVNSI